jgi:hypothetical protein
LAHRPLALRLRLLAKFKQNQTSIPINRHALTDLQHCRCLMYSHNGGYSVLSRDDRAM